MRGMIARIDRAWVRGVNFLYDLHYFWRVRRHPFRRAVYMAREAPYYD